MNELMIPVSLGELYDKISILEIKKRRIYDEDKLENITDELDKLMEIMESSIKINMKLYVKLKDINERLWDIEDKIRDKERRKEFDKGFIDLARSVYISNDVRCNIKREINQQYGSSITEEKSYKPY